MDISIAVSLIRGQMGTVVEQAVNGAVETVLAEMLKVVGAKFEELKGQVAHMKRDIVSLQREKALKEKENENIRAKLRYTELKLKYYRQGVEEELQQRASASGLVRIHPPTFLPSQRGGAGVSSNEVSASCSAQNRTSEGGLMRTSQECTSPLNNKRRRGIRARCHADLSDLLPPASLSADTPSESVDSSTVLFSPVEQEATQSPDDDQEEDCEWSIATEPHTDAVDSVEDPPQVQTLTLDSGQPSESSIQADCSTPHSSAPQVKQEPQQQDVICIKEEPEEEQVSAALLMDCQVQQSHPPESEALSSLTEWPEHPDHQRNHSAVFSAAGTNSYVMPQPSALPSLAALQPPNAPHQVEPPWTNDLSLYEEYKMRRNELRRMNLSRRRELEKMLPQPLLADLVRERREKTRLRVARWRAKRKLQAGLNQIQPEGGAAGFSSNGFPLSGQHQQLRAACASSSGGQQRQSSPLPPSSSFLNNSLSNTLSFISASSSSSSSSLHLSNSSMALHPHAVTSSSSSSPSYPQVSLSQHGLSLGDPDIIQCRV
ncbi:uncharacterized protein si:ch211-67e16.4 isoform X2 [Notolabrus celidotus]|uniref:uncharacterized protein si:ch211-67e16.4 isoform X2 n=1 Tax=Notolabrus celidotus TaxID=1203425 RepID=UPI00148F6D79|nr:uncharacterized protein si:ch211-67e16.4 isoform X2 [Notolabrus celidotus]XP_034534958.1 uncharacterized protein si:ch211-67e16.4 isoform X2 [Notolabrus celidotus]